MNAAPRPQPVPAPPAPGRGARDRGLSHHERVPRRPANRRSSASTRPRAEHHVGGTRYGGADFADIGRELILKTLPISGPVLTAPAGARQPGCASPPVPFALHRLADMRSCLSARNRVTSTAIRLLWHRHRTRQRPHRYSRNHRNRRVILPILLCLTDPRPQAHVITPYFDPKRRSAHTWAEAFYQPVAGRLIAFPG